jgi:hypothetical protein
MTLATLARMITAKHKSKYFARLWAVSLAFARLARTHVALPHVEHVEATAAASVAMHFPATNARDGVVQVRENGFFFSDSKCLSRVF